MGTDRISWLNQPTRRRILEAAEERFADVGFDVARVGDIANSARVSKSHLYYHFPSKEALLTGLIELRQAELLTSKDQILGNLTSRSLNGDPADLATALNRIFVEALRPRQRFLRIVLIEALKNSEAVEPVFAGFNAMIEDAIGRFRELEAPFDPTRAKALLFHFALIPAFFAVALDSSRIGLDVNISDLTGDLAVIEQSFIRTILRGDQ